MFYKEIERLKEVVDLTKNTEEFVNSIANLVVDYMEVFDIEHTQTLLNEVTGKNSESTDLLIDVTLNELTPSQQIVRFFQRLVKERDDDDHINFFEGVIPLDFYYTLDVYFNDTIIQMGTCDALKHDSKQLRDYKTELSKLLIKNERIQTAYKTYMLAYLIDMTISLENLILVFNL